MGGASTANGAAVIQWGCNGQGEQSWNFVAGSASDQYTLHNSNSGKCLAIGASSTVAGAEAIQWTCDGNSDQVWTYDSLNRLKNLNSGLCLAIGGSSTTAGVQAIQWSCSTTNADQQWSSV